MFGVRDPTVHMAPAAVLRGMRRRMGQAVHRATPFAVPMLTAVLRHLDTRPPTVKSLCLALALILGVFGFLRPSDVFALNRGGVKFVSHPRFPHVLLHLDHSKTDPLWAGAWIILCALTLAGLNIAGRLRRYMAALDAEWAGEPEWPLFPAGAGAGRWTAAQFTEEFRAVLEHLKAEGDPEFEHTDISSVSLRSLKRGGAASAAAGGAHPAAINVHGWVSRRTVENLRGSSMLETYCDVFDHSIRESLPRRHQVTFLMGACPSHGPAPAVTTTQV